ncbi:hypothetical protein [Neopusillimonas aromaticivorans]|uniref:hypothetical protein n=1 Tax=Neopusillimonas aromaticivorans TaxID=2979868 RepID=UPI00259A8C46|nr:hypothetical protein [Neopusillimonas aromaticivorans]WJJ92609.1 hypothetical protein N7E01_09605 [Neopusillimonas aromaticivorans]
MTISLTEGRLTFGFPADDIATQYDEWSFYRNQFNSCFGGTKAVDFVYVDARALWLIEVKDYRRHARTKIQDLGEEIAHKVRDTMAGLLAARANANDADEKWVARKATAKHLIRVVLHLEQPVKRSKLFPQVVDSTKLQLKLRQLLKPVDAHPRVVNRSSMPHDMRWTVTG